MPIDGKEPHRISLEHARRLTRRAREERAEGARRSIYAHSVSRGVIDEILAQPGCLGLRIYQAVNDEGVDTLVIVGITGDESDMADGIIAEETRPCPPFCKEGPL